MILLSLSSSSFLSPITIIQKTPYRTAFNRLLEGEYFNSIQCLDVNYESVSVQSFFDINVPIKGYASLEDSLKASCTDEILDGENKYKAEKYGYQRAKKVSFHLTLIMNLSISSPLVSLNYPLYFTFHL